MNLIDIQRVAQDAISKSLPSLADTFEYKMQDDSLRIKNLNLRMCGDHAGFIGVIDITNGLVVLNICFEKITLDESVAELLNEVQKQTMLKVFIKDGFLMASLDGVIFNEYAVKPYLTNFFKMVNDLPEIDEFVELTDLTELTDLPQN